MFVHTLVYTWRLFPPSLKFKVHIEAVNSCIENLQNFPLIFQFLSNGFSMQLLKTKDQCFTIKLFFHESRLLFSLFTASSSQKSSSNARPKLPQLLRQNQKSIHLSGVKRVGLSRKYKGGKNFSAKPSIAAIACSEFSFPPSPDSDVSSSSFERGCPDVK